MQSSSPGRTLESQERVAIFIDGSNLYHALRENPGRTDLNFAEFVKKLVGPRRLFRTYYYNILQEPSQNPDGYREQQEFLEALRKSPYLEIRLGRTKTHQGVQVEKGVDIMLATDMLVYGWNDLYDVAILVSGDGDFAYALQTVKNIGKHVEVAYFERNVSRDLLDVADYVYVLNRSFLEDLWWSRRSKHRVGGRTRGGRRQQVQQQELRPPDMRPPEPSIIEARPAPPAVPEPVLPPQVIQASPEPGPFGM
ncbi:MAG: NYN domain-containing protein [Chloroflexi bacterium]|nr:NYN domain-containing protein [Chloroflexota bacterium]